MEEEVSISTDQLDTEEAETHNFNAIQGRRFGGSDNNNRLGELLGNYSNNTAVAAAPDRPSLQRQSSSKKKWLQATRRVQMMNRFKEASQSHKNNNNSSGANNKNGRGAGHRKQQASRAYDLLSSLQVSNHHGDKGNGGAQDNAADGSPTKKNQHSSNSEAASGGAALSDQDNMFLRLIREEQELYQAAGIASGKSSDNDSENDNDDDDAEVKSNEDETLPLTSREVSPVSYGSDDDKNNNNNNNASQNFVDSIKTQRHRLKKNWRRSCFKNLTRNPLFVLDFLYHRVMKSCYLWVALPLFAIAWIVYYGAGNPIPEFLPGQVSLAWWLDFVGRQVLTLALARIAEYLTLDCLLLSQNKVLGPLVTMTALQARGYPFILVAWALIDLCIFHGSGKFAAHWLYWTGLRIYSPTHAATGSYILQSTMYLRVLLSMIVAGCAVTAKRVYVAIRFGLRMLNDFKPRLEKLLADMVLLTEIAELSVEAEQFAEEEKRKQQHQQRSFMAIPGKKRSMSWSNVTFSADADDSSSSSSSDEEAEESTTKSTLRHRNSSEPELERSGSGRILLKHLLDSWDEPNYRSKQSGSNATLHDVLKFKRALTYMDEEHPFSEAYGPATDRNQSIASSHSVYFRLVKFNTPEEKQLNFDILSIVATDDFGGIDSTKLKRLKKLFPPDANNELSLLAFVQSCDAVYKKLRFFRASVGNSSAIDDALESIVDGVFWFVLALSLLSIMNFNPWPILVSITSLLVSVSFALGSSVSKYVEGVLLIAVRRPFDLGDRIIISSCDEVETTRAGLSWFVEDISLFSTTLRFAITNEVSTLNNFSISQARIVNLQRSNNAVVYLEKMDFHVDIIRKNKLGAFRGELEQYVRDRPRIWESFDTCRHDDFDASVDKVTFAFGFRHRSSWQSAARIAIDRASLVRFIYETAVGMGVEYGYDNSPSPKRLILQGGEYQRPDKSATDAVSTLRKRQGWARSDNPMVPLARS